MNKRHALIAISGLSLVAISIGIAVPTIVTEVNKNSINSSNSGDSVVVDNNISNIAITNIQNALNDMNLDNFKLFFEGANNSPDNNPGRMTSSILSNISGIPIDAIQENGIKVTKAGNTDNGYLIVNISIKLNSPYLYNNNNEIIINNINTSVFDPNSQFNLNLFKIEGNSLQGFTTEGINYSGVLYVPNIVNYVFLPNYYFDNNSLKSKVINFEYADFYNFSTDYQQFLNSPFQKIIFRNNESFNTFNNWGMFQNSLSLEEVDFENCKSLNAILNTTFAGCTKLSILNFKNCTSLSTIEDQAFQNCSSLTSLDFSDSPITSVGTNAFSGCSNLKEIVVQKNSVQYFEAAVQSSNINAKVIGV